MAKRALCLGINDYPGTGLDLQGAVNDAKAWVQLFKERKIGVMDCLLDKAATKKRIMKGIAELLKATGAGDLALLTFSGHGTWVPDLDGDELDGRDEAWCPYDVEDNVILDDELFQLFDKYRNPQARVCIISDSCHSGTVMRAVPPTNIRRVMDRRMRFLSPYQLRAFRKDVPALTKKRIEQAALREKVQLHSPGVVLLAACSDKEYAFDVNFEERPHGAYTHTLHQLIPKLPARATYRDLHNLVRRYMPCPDYPQTPQISGPKYAQSWSLFTDGSGR